MYKIRTIFSFIYLWNILCCCQLLFCFFFLNSLSIVFYSPQWNFVYCFFFLLSFFLYYCQFSIFQNSNCSFMMTMYTMFTIQNEMFECIIIDHCIICANQVHHHHSILIIVMVAGATVTMINMIIIVSIY